jgi:hypothetical protein
VRQVAGATLYLDVGTRQGLAAGDSLPAARDPLGPPVGVLVVTAVSDSRSVLAPAGAPFAVAAGDSLSLWLRREPPPARAEAAPRLQPETPPPAVRTPVAPDRQPYGRLALELAAGQYLTRFGGPETVERASSSATPAFRLDVTFPNLGAGFRLRMGTRLAYRYEDRALGTPATSLRVYSAALERDLPGSTVRVALGRFHSPTESYSGFWDGLHVRYGRSVGVGMLIGFQPDLWNERPSIERPKATLVLDAERRGAGWRWSADASLHRTWGGALPSRTFVGLTQTLTASALRLSHDVQVDRDPAADGWHLSRGTLRGSLAIGRAVELRAAFARRSAYLEYGEAPRFDAPRDRVSAGVFLGLGEGHLSADVARMTDPIGSARAYTVSFVGPSWLPAAGRLEGATSYWEGSSGASLSAAPALALTLGGGDLRAGYRYDRSDYLDRAFVTHGAELSLDFAIGSATRAAARIRGQRGESTRSALVDLSLYRSF